MEGPFCVQCRYGEEPAGDLVWGPSCLAVGSREKTHHSQILLPPLWHPLWGAFWVRDPGGTQGPRAKGRESAACLGLFPCGVVSISSQDGSKPRGRQRGSRLESPDRATQSLKFPHLSVQKIRTNIKILGKPHFINKRFYLDPAFKIVLPRRVLAGQVSTPSFQPAHRGHSPQDAAPRLRARLPAFSQSPSSVPTTGAQPGLPTVSPLGTPRRNGLGFLWVTPCPKDGP